MTTPTPIAAVADKVVDAGTGQNVPVLTMRMGKVISVNDQDTTIDVGLQLSGAVDENSGAIVELTGVKIIGAYVPVVGDTVWCLKNGADLPLVLGKVATSTPRGPIRFLQRASYVTMNSTSDTNVITFNATLDGGLYEVGVTWGGLTCLSNAVRRFDIGLKTSGGNYWIIVRTQLSSGSYAVGGGGAPRQVIDSSNGAYTLTYFVKSVDWTAGNNDYLEYNRSSPNVSPPAVWLRPWDGTLTVA